MTQQNAVSAAVLSAASEAPTTLSGSQVRRIYGTLERLQRERDALAAQLSEPIAIVGMACHFPGDAGDTDRFWQSLCEGSDAISTVPANRFDADELYDPTPQTPGRISSKWGGFVSDIDRFDHEFFAISAREAATLDPQHRLVLEVCWEALEDADIDPTSLAGSRAGVFVAIANNDYAGQTLYDVRHVTAHASTGSAHSIAAGRISYLLDLKGPSEAIDSACSSSLTAVHRACQSLRLGESSSAICAGVNVILSAAVTASFSQFPEMLAADGRCKPFDADADGFVRSEGCAAVVLKRVSDAGRDGDRILAVIRGTAVNQDGRTSGLTSPNGEAQRDVIRSALAAAGVDPAEIGYVEAHGAGTKLGDPIEMEALADVYGRDHGPDLFLGAVKSNLGHLETAAGMAGLVKTVLVLQHGEIPANLHFHRLNPHIDLRGTTFRLPTTTVPWPEGYQRRLAGLSSFGFSGSNAHLILSAADPSENAREVPATPATMVLPLSARSPASLAKLGRRYRDRLIGTGPDELGDVCHTAGAGRAHFPHRLALWTGDGDDAAARLGHVTRGRPDTQVVTGRARPPAAADAVFLFTGQGAQRIHMGRELMATQPHFRAAMERCDEILRPHLDVPLLRAIHPPTGGDENLVDRMPYAQPALFAIEYSLAELWRSWGIVPTALLGHSIGELAAACFAGVMPLEQALPLVALRGRLLDRLADSGAMLAVHADADLVNAHLRGFDASTISLAAVNSPRSVAVSGLRTAVDRFAEHLTAAGIDCKPLNIATASHSPLVEPLLEEFRRATDTIELKPPRIPLISNLDGRPWAWNSPPRADYWVEHLRRPVQFAAGMRTVLDLGHRTFVEVGPTATLLGMMGEHLDAGPTVEDVLLLPSMRRVQPENDVLGSTLAHLYVGGATVDWTAVGAARGARFTSVPHYAFDRVRSWHAIPAGTAPEPAARGGDPTEGTPTAPALAVPVRVNLPLRTYFDGLAAEELADALVPPMVAAVQTALRSPTAPELDTPLIGLGLDSLLALELRNEVRRQLGVQLSVADLLGAGTLRSISTKIADVMTRQDRGEATDETDAPVRRSGRQAIDDDLLARVEAMDAPATRLEIRT
jgi:acyl transferase domain-containing protein